MNIKEDIVFYHKRYKPIPKPFYVTRIDEHYMVCTLDDEYNLIDEVSEIHWNHWVVRRWAFHFAEKAKERALK